MTKQAARIIFYALAAMVFLWTASLSYQFLSDVLPGFGRTMPAVGLIVLDLGVVAWEDHSYLFVIGGRWAGLLESQD